MIQFNKNSFGLAPGTQNVPVPQLAPGTSQTAVLPLVQNPTLVSPTAASAVLQVRHILHIPVTCGFAGRPQDAICSYQGVLARQTTKHCTIQSHSFSRCLCSINSLLQQAPMGILIYISFCADIQVAIRNTQQGVFYFTDQIPLTALMVEDGRIEPAAFVQSWKNLPEANESQKELPISITSLDMVKSKIEAANIFLMAHKQVLPLAVLFAKNCVASTYIVMAWACWECNMLHLLHACQQAQYVCQTGLSCTGVDSCLQHDLVYIGQTNSKVCVEIAVGLDQIVMWCRCQTTMKR